MPIAPQPTLVLSPRSVLATLSAGPPSATPAPQVTPLENPYPSSPLSDPIPARPRSRPSGTRSLAAADFDVSALSGFLPSEPPIERLTARIGGGWESFELALESVQAEVKPLEGGGVGRVGDEWRSRVQKLALPSVAALSSLPLLRRAHLVLSFLGHFYIHSTFPSLKTVPASIAVSWIAVSDKLGVPAVLTYADTVLWNWRLIDPSRGLHADNVAIVTTFTSSPSEEAFFILSLLCELRAPPLLCLMASVLDECAVEGPPNFNQINADLADIEALVNLLASDIGGATKGAFGERGEFQIVPECFYWEIRPWYNGGTWTYEGVVDPATGALGLACDFGGPSAGQSSLVHVIDLFLGVDHTPRPPHSHAAPVDITRPSPRAPPVADKDATFMLRAAKYMPGPHRAFLHHLCSFHLASPSNPRPIPPIRAVAAAHRADLGAAYDAAVRAMRAFRDMHFRLVTIFIISQAKRPPGAGSVFSRDWAERHEQGPEERAREAEREGLKKETLLGTGGTALVPFLKGCRERTVEALL